MGSREAGARPGGRSPARPTAGRWGEPRPWRRAATAQPPRKGCPQGIASRQRRPAPAGRQDVGGEAPGATRSAATSVGLALRASRARRARGRCVQHRGAAQVVGERSEPAAPPPTEVAARCAAPPRARRRRALEAAGREGMSSRTGGASSPATPGESALADVPKARPGGWPDWHASALTGKTSTSFLS